MVAPADASMIFSGGKTCRKLRALLPNMKDDRSSLSAGASSRCPAGSLAPYWT